MDRRPTDTTNNTINFLNTLSEEKLRTMGIKDGITIITQARKFIGKHQHVESFQSEEDIMLHQIKSFKGLFVELFQKGLPPFWDEDGK